MAADVQMVIEVDVQHEVTVGQPGGGVEKWGGGVKWGVMGGGYEEGRRINGGGGNKWQLMSMWSSRCTGHSRTLQDSWGGG